MDCLSAGSSRSPEKIRPMLPTDSAPTPPVPTPAQRVEKRSGECVMIRMTGYYRISDV